MYITIPYMDGSGFGVQAMKPIPIPEYGTIFTLGWLTGVNVHGVSGNGGLKEVDPSPRGAGMYGIVSIDP